MDTRTNFLTRFNNVVDINDYKLQNYNSLESASKNNYKDFYVIKNKKDQIVGQLAINYMNSAAVSFDNSFDKLTQTYLTAYFFYGIIEKYGNNMKQYNVDMVNLLIQFNAAGIKKRKVKKSKKQRKIKKKSKTFRRFA
jgi:hypothetical protein